MPSDLKKKNHHFIHYGYLSAWKITDRIFVYNLISHKEFCATGRNSVGAIGGYNNFSFDEVVVGLLNDAFADRAIRADAGGVYNLMLQFTNFMKDFDYKHKTENLLEDFYEKLEAQIDFSLKSLSRGDILVHQKDPAVWRGLIFFFCLQLMRTPKARSGMSGKMERIFCNGVEISEVQKDEFIKMWLFISSLAMALDIINSGCAINIRYARWGEKFINCDSPVCTNYNISDITEMRGAVPLTPRLLMEIEMIGAARLVTSYSDISNHDVMSHNKQMIFNAEKMVYFSSGSQRDKYRNLMATLRRHSAPEH